MPTGVIPIACGGGDGGDLAKEAEIQRVEGVGGAGLDNAFSYEV